VRVFETHHKTLLLTRTGFTKRRLGAFAQPDVSAFPTLPQLVHGADRLFKAGIGVDAVEIVEVWRATQPLNGAFDVFVDMGRFVGDCQLARLFVYTLVNEKDLDQLVIALIESVGSILLTHVESAFRGDEHFVPGSSLFEKVADQLLIVTCTVDDSAVPECTAELDGLLERFERRGIVGGAVTHGKAHGAETRNGDIDILEWEPMYHF
jgi:hypothetical protein